MLERIAQRDSLSLRERKREDRITQVVNEKLRSARSWVFQRNACLLSHLATVETRLPKARSSNDKS